MLKSVGKKKTSPEATHTQHAQQHAQALVRVRVDVFPYIILYLVTPFGEKPQSNKTAAVE